MSREYDEEYRKEANEWMNAPMGDYVEVVDLYEQALGVLAQLADQAHEEERQSRTMPRIHSVMAARASALNQAFDAVVDLKKENETRSG